LLGIGVECRRAPGVAEARKRQPTFSRIKRAAQRAISLLTCSVESA
jgi:hypothetical protein